MQDTSLQDSSVFGFCCVCTIASSSVGWGSCRQTFSHLPTLSSISLHHRRIQGLKLIEGAKWKAKRADLRAWACLCEFEHVCVCLCLCDRERDKTNKMEKRLTMLSSLSQCFPATCQLNHQDTGDTSEVLSSQQDSPPRPRLKLFFPLPIRTPSTRIQRAAERQFIKYAQLPKTNL